MSLLQYFPFCYRSTTCYFIYREFESGPAIIPFPHMSHPTPPTQTQSTNQIPPALGMVVNYHAPVLGGHKLTPPVCIGICASEWLDRGKERPHESNASSSSTTLNHPSSSHPLDDTFDENNDESFHSNSSSPSQNISSSSNVVSRVRQNPPHESYNLNSYLSETVNL
uniref:Uncharacterized protein n=1 Tax=Tanacetum cinerariifolium TaxID=118510 RepID=A0A699HYR9_TANCI|nr:hypothetical protein [Tanacetum cinerariifolium]